MKKTCLVTGGLGYIGSHICVKLLKNNWNILILDNLSNSSIEKFDTIKKYNSKSCDIKLEVVDLVDFDKFDLALNNYINEKNKKIDLVIHLAGLKAVGESIDLPIKYYENNLISTLNLVKLMEKYSISNLIFSSSATVYGTAQTPYFENTQTGMGISNPYGRSKYLQEEILKDICLAKKNWNICLLRYFNPIGHLNLELKEDPNGIPNNLFPYLIKVYKGELKELAVFGQDYETRDGTCSRDFVHVVDLANAHLVCGLAMCEGKISGLKIYNVGTGLDTTVLELISEFEKQNQTKLNYKFGTRRQGDLMTSYSNVELIKKELGWRAKYSISDCVKIE
jgi:UDP-glucose 4-epimerase